jgi:uncharacterized protein
MPSLDQARDWYPRSDPIHGFDHILRVYAIAERLAASEGADLEIVRAAALLHDADSGASAVGDQRIAEAESPMLAGDPSPQISDPVKRSSHHHSSASFARLILRQEGWPDERIAAVQHCIRAHRFRDDSEQPQTLEAQVLFDADKLDAIGAIGVARAVAFAARDGQPAYAEPSQRFLATGQLEPGEAHSSYHEFVFKLARLKERLYTPTARRIAEERHRLMVDFYQRLAAEMRGEK